MLLAILVFFAGCGGAQGQEIRDWNLQRDSGARPVRFPVHLEDELGNHVAHYRISTEVTVEPGLLGQDLDLTLAYLPATVTLRVNGAEVPAAGDPEVRPRYRHIGPHRWTIPRSEIRDGRISLELDVLHSWTQSAWLDVAPRLARAGAVTRVMAVNRAFNDRGGWFGLISLSQMGAAFLAIYFWDRQRRAYLWFGIQGLAASYYPAYVLGFTTSLPRGVEFLGLAQALSIAPIISVYFTHEFFGLGKPHRAWPVLLLVSMFVPVPAMFPTFVNSAYGTPGVILCVVTVIIYQVTVGTRLVFTYADRGIALFFLCSWLALAGSAWIDLWAWIGGGEVLDGARPACVGLALFGMFQALLLSRNYVRSLQESDRLNLTLSGRLKELEARHAEIGALNEELRQQVGRRSAHILAALSGSEGSRSSVQLEPGDLVEDRYRVIGALGSGGMGTVYEVERLHDQRRLALKVTHQSRGPDLSRLAREAQLASRVHHPNVVTIVDTDVASAGYVYLVMELVEGCSLADREGQEPVRWRLDVLTQMLEGIGALHAQGIIHRDLKPANVLLSGDLETAPLVKITDFGISRGFSLDDAPPGPSLPRAPALRPDDATVRISADGIQPPDATQADAGRGRARKSRLAGAGAHHITRTGTIAGTPSYVAPELARRGAEPTPAVDLFSFGVVAYRLLTGSPPHKEAPFLARLDGREAAVHVPLGRECPLLPKQLAHLLDACLAYSPEARPAVADLLRALRDAAEVTEPDLHEVPVETA